MDVISGLLSGSIVIEKEWGKEYIVARNDNYVIKILFVDSKQRTSLQYHKEKTESLVIIKGDGCIKVYENEQLYMEYKSGCMITVNPYKKHRIEAGLEPTYVLEISTNHLDDVVRLEDDYGRDK